MQGTQTTLVQSLWSLSDDRGGYCVRDGESLDRMPWSQVRQRATDVAATLRAAGVKPGDRVAILSDTRREWKLADHGIHAAGAVVVPIYPTLPADVTQYILQDAGASIVFVEDAAQAAKLPDDVQAWSFDPVDGLPQLDDIPAADADPIDTQVAAGSLDDPALLIYTSGTTGVPKGVLLTHRNIAGDVAGAVQGLWLHEIPEASLVAFLPLAHIAGYVSLSAMTSIQADVLFSAPDRMAADLQWFRPRIALAVPRLWERIVRKVEEAVAEGSAVKRFLFARAKATALAVGPHMEDGGNLSGWLAFRHALWERIIYRKIRAKLGFDRLEIGITGAAAVRPDLLWLLQGMGLPIIEGYGMTESSALTSSTRLESWRAGTVGTPLPGSKVAVDDDGEILIGGVGVFQQYWNLPDETASTRVTMDGEPWIRSGDIGELDDAGNLRIVDRKKELEVLDTGKMIAPVRVEEMLKAETNLVEDSCLIGTGRKFAGMLIQPAYDALIAWAAKHGIQPDPEKVVRRPAPTGEVQTYSIEDEWFLQHPDIRGAFQSAIDALNDRVADFERVRTFTLIPHAFTVDRDELTPSFKKRRRDIVAHYREKVEALFGGRSNDRTA